MLKKDMPNGVIIYQGPSVLDGSPIVVIANSLKRNKNRKIGDMIQTWILRSDIHPNDALKSGDDISICGDCIHRGHYDEATDTVKDRTCYVNLYQQGVFSIYNAYKRGSYPVFNFEHIQIFKDRHIRFGSYGDPAAVPVYVWRNLATLAKDYTGYTHMWHSCSTELSKYCMASVETVDQYKHANSKGFRTFRLITDPNEAKDDNEISCPAQTHGAHCDKCSFCNGSTSNRKNVTVVFHGAMGRDRVYNKKFAKIQ